MAKDLALACGRRADFGCGETRPFFDTNAGTFSVETESVGLRSSTAGVSDTPQSNARQDRIMCRSSRVPVLAAAVRLSLFGAVAWQLRAEPDSAAASEPCVGGVAGHRQGADTDSAPDTDSRQTQTVRRTQPCGQTHRQRGQIQTVWQTADSAGGHRPRGQTQTATPDTDNVAGRRQRSATAHERSRTVVTRSGHSRWHARGEGQAVGSYRAPSSAWPQ
jgi:hypothetical protein